MTQSAGSTFVGSRPDRCAQTAGGQTKSIGCIPAGDRQVVGSEVVGYDVDMFGAGEGGVETAVYLGRTFAKGVAHVDGDPFVDVRAFDGEMSVAPVAVTATCSVLVKVTGGSGALVIVPS